MKNRSAPRSHHAEMMGRAASVTPSNRPELPVPARPPFRQLLRAFILPLTSRLPARMSPGQHGPLCVLLPPSALHFSAACWVSCGVCLSCPLLSFSPSKGSPASEAEGSTLPPRRGSGGMN